MCIRDRSEDVARYDKELERISENISTLSSAKTQQIQYKDSDGNLRNSVSTTELRAAQSRITIEEQNRKEVQSKRQIAADSLQSIQLKILEIDTNVEVGSELGPLEYLSGLLGKPMDVIINWFILIIIFVFDPLAIALVVAFNNAMKVDRGEEDKKKVIQKRELYGDDLSADSTDKETQKELLVQMMNDDEVSGLYDSSDEELIIDKDGDGIISEEEYNEWYENGGWKTPYKDGAYYTNPRFDWSKRERWINDRKAIEYWISYQGGNQKAVEEYQKQFKYPTDFTSKTY